MGFRINIIALSIGLVFFILVLKAIKKNSFRPSYASLWLFMSLFLVTIPLGERFYRWIARSIIGFSDARHLIYIGLIGFLLVYVFYLTKKVSLMNDQIQELISTVAILDHEIEQSQVSGSDDSSYNPDKSTKDKA